MIEGRTGNRGTTASSAAIIVMVCCILPACSTTTVLSDSTDPFATFNDDARGRTVLITLRDSRTVTAQKLIVGLDSTTFIEEGHITTTPCVVPSVDVQKVVINHRGQGFLEGGWIGSLVGGAATGVLALTVSPYFVLAVPLAGAGGFLVGGVVGLIRGHNVEYTFTADPQRSSESGTNP